MAFYRVHAYREVQMWTDIEADSVEQAEEAVLDVIHADWEEQDNADPVVINVELLRT